MVKKFKENLQWLQELYTCITSFLRKSHQDAARIRDSKGKGVQEEEISKGVGSDSQGLFSRDFETRIIIDDLTLHC